MTTQSWITLANIVCGGSWIFCALAQWINALEVADHVENIKKNITTDKGLAKYIFRFLRFPAMSGVLALILALLNEDLIYFPLFVGQLVLACLIYNISAKYPSPRTPRVPKNEPTKSIKKA